MVNRILFYPACVAHVRNFEFIRKEISNCYIEAINVEPYRPYEVGLEKTIRDHGYNYHTCNSANIPEDIFSFKPDIVVFGCGGEDAFTIQLFLQAMNRGMASLLQLRIYQLLWLN